MNEETQARDQEFVQKLSYNQLMQAAKVYGVGVNLTNRFYFFVSFVPKPRPKAIADEIARRAYIRGDEVRKMVKAQSN
jgi:hypothetical protein